MKELSTPPDKPIRWKFARRISAGKVSHLATTVRARTWFDARREAARLLGVGPEELVLVG